MSIQVIDPTRKSTAAEHSLNSVGWADGKAYIYLQADGAVATGRVVDIEEGQADEAVDASNYGPVAVATQAFSDNEYGWFQIYGITQLDSNGDIAAGDDLYVHGTGTGHVTATSVTDAILLGARAVEARTGDGLFDAFISFPQQAALN